MAVNTYLSVVTLNINGWNSVIRWHRVTKWIKTNKQDLSMWCLWETPFRCKDTHSLKLKGWKKVLHTNGNLKKSGSSCHPWKRYYIWYHRNAKDHRRLLWTNLCQQIRQSGRNLFLEINSWKHTTYQDWIIMK